MPFGSLANGESGTYFSGYAADPAVTEQVPRNMFLGSPPGNTDRILDYSTAVTGGLFSVPPASFLDAADSLAALDALGADPTSLASEPASEPGVARADGSWGVGGLKRSTA